MKKLLGIIFTLAVCFPLISRSSTLRIGTYNLRMQHMDKGDNDWEKYRRDRVMRSIKDNKFDIFGVQELTDFAQEDLKKYLGDTYQCVFFSPYSQDGKGTKAQGILFNKKRFKLVEYHYFWSSDTDPSKMVENDHLRRNGKIQVFKRGGVCAVLKEKKTGRKIFFMNNHGILNKDENLKYAQVFVDIEKKYNPNGYPSFFVGDLNARPNHPSHQIYRQYWKDAADMVSEKPVTFNGFKSKSTEWNPEAHIDYIYYRNIPAPLNYQCNQTLYDGFCASDHFPVFADFILE